MIIEISIAVIAGAFLVLVAFLIFTLVATKRVLVNLNYTLAFLQSQLRSTGDEAHKAVLETNLLLNDLRGKMQAIDPLFNTLSNLGEVAECVSNSAREQYRANCVSQKIKAAHKSEETTDIKDIAEWAFLGVNLWRKFKK